MMHIVIVFLCIILFLPLFTLFARWYVNKMTYLIVGKKHDAIEWILQTGDVPPLWLKTIIFKNKGKKPVPFEPYEIKVSGKYIRNLHKLINYMKITSMVENEAERKNIIQQLENVRQEWEKRRLVSE